MLIYLQCAFKTVQLWKTEESPFFVLHGQLYMIHI